MLGFEEAIHRANAMLEAGADVAFVEAPQTLDEVRAVPKLVKGPCLLNMVWGGKTPEVSIRGRASDGLQDHDLPGPAVQSRDGRQRRGAGKLARTGPASDAACRR